MKTAQKATTQEYEHESVAQSGDQVGIGIITVLSALIGIWGVACFVGGVSQYGIVGLAKGWLTAVMG